MPRGSADTGELSEEAVNHYRLGLAEKISKLAGKETSAQVKGLIDYGEVRNKSNSQLDDLATELAAQTGKDQTQILDQLMELREVAGNLQGTSKKMNRSLEVVQYLPAVDEFINWMYGVDQSPALLGGQTKPPSDTLTTVRETAEVAKDATATQANPGGKYFTNDAASQGMSTIDHIVSP